MSEVSLRNSISEVLEDCWRRIARNETFIYFPQITDLLQDFQSRVTSSFGDVTNQSKELLSHEEMQTILQMSESNPTLKFYHGELEDFILKLVGSPSLLSFISSRTGYDKNELMRLFSRPNGSLSERYLTSKSAKPPSSIPDTDRRNSYFASRESTRSYIPPSPPQSPRIRPHSQPETSYYKRSFPSDEAGLERASIENRSLRNQIRRQKEEMDLLQSRASPFSEKQLIRDLMKQIEEKDSLIMRLENLDRSEHDELMNRLTNGIRKQDSLIEKLKDNLALEFDANGNKQLNDKSQTLNSFLRNLPFVKQYYIYYKQQQEQTWKSVIINLGTLILTTVLLLNILQFVLYFTLMSSSFISGWNADDNFNSYLYATDNSGWSTSDHIKFQWWKEIEWLEYWVYTIDDWVDS